MAGGDVWIKMRGSLLDHPKTIAMTRILVARRDFREWLTPGGSGPMNGQIVRHEASRCVTIALLLKVWSTARDTGKFVGDDLHLEHSTVEDLDEFSGAPGFGEAMKNVGWVVERPSIGGVFLPNFKEFNVPKTDAERAKDYRERGKRAITQSSRSSRDENAENVTPRGRGREEITPPTPQGGVVDPVDFALFWDAWPAHHRKVDRKKCATAWRAGKLWFKAEEIVAHIEGMKASLDWTKEGGKYVPAPLVYLNKRSWEAGLPGGGNGANGEHTAVLTRLRQQYGSQVNLAPDGTYFWDQATQRGFTLEGERKVVI